MGQKKTANSKNSNTKIAFYALGLLVGLIVLGKSLNFIYSLNQPTTPNLTPRREYSLNSNSTLNFVFISPVSADNSSLSLVSYYPTDQKTIILHIPDQTYLEVPKDYGLWPISSVYDLGQAEKPPKGAELLDLSIYKLTGLPIDGLIFFQKDQTITQLLTDLRKNPLGPILAAGQNRSNLTLLEQYSLYKKLAAIRSDKITSLDLAQSSITESKLLPDSSRVLGVDTFKLDSFIRDKMADPQLIEEAYSIAIYNATSHPGLGQEAARIVTNMGGNVVITSTSSTPVSRSQIILTKEADKLKDTVTAHRLAEVFAPQCLKNLCTSNDSDIQNSRAQINLILGEDFYNFWHKR